MTETFDVIVVGGGPGGSTAATLSAMRGHRVLLLEREAFPVYKIGESLLPATVHGVCAMLGVAEELKQANFVVKQGGTFKWGRAKKPWTFQFSLSPEMRGPTSFAFQVERLKFDAILWNNAKRRGVDVRERHTVRNLLHDDAGRVCGLAFDGPDGERREVRSKFVIDASGWTSVLNRHVGTRIYSEFFRNLAIFGYFENGGRLPAPNAGNIFCVAFDRGWFWYIPLSDTLTSVGAVIGEEHAHVVNGDPDQVLHDLVGECEPVRDLLSGAKRAIGPPYDKVRVRKDFSYCHSRFWQPGIALVGDAACFIDPVFSSGVHLSTYSAVLAARSVNTCLRDELPEERSFSEFERRYLREYRYFYDFLISFYDMDQDLESYYWSARKILNSGEASNEAFVRLVGGIGGSGEQLYGSGAEYLRTRAALSRHLFAGVSPELAQAARSAGTAAEADRRVRTEFMQGLFTELTHLQAQAVVKHAIRPVPLFKDGLVPTEDSLALAEPSA